MTTPKERKQIVDLYDTQKTIIENAKKITLIIKINEKIVKRVLQVHRKETGITSLPTKVLNEAAKNVIKTLVEENPEITNRDIMRQLKERKLPFSDSTVKIEKARVKFR